jgi:replication factor C small subunit
VQKTIWSEKYRPRHISEIIYQNEKQKNLFTRMVESGDIPNLLLSGIQGTGKSTTSAALIRDLKIPKADVLRIPCSDEKIEALRDRASAFAMTMPLGTIKIIQLEEFDYLSKDAQALLRTLIEDTSSVCRFICTCNYADRIIVPLRSRLNEITFKAPDKELVALRMCDILDAEKVTYTPEQILAHVDLGYPDIRKITSLLQVSVENGVLQAPVNGMGEVADWKFKLMDVLDGKLRWSDARAVICSSTPREDIESVYRFLYDNIDKFGPHQKDATLLIAEFLYKHAFVADPEINLAALFIMLEAMG